MELGAVGGNCNCNRDPDRLGVEEKGNDDAHVDGMMVVGEEGLPRLTVSLTRPPSSSRRSVSADSLEVVATRRPYARWDMKRRARSSASVCMVPGMMIFRYMLPS